MLNVLVVERDPKLAWLYREELAEAGFRVGVCSSLDNARAWLVDHPTHVMVTDLGSVGENPDAWMPSLRRCFSGPVVMLGSGHCTQRRDPRVVTKSSDLMPLISRLRSHALAASWHQAANA